MGQAQAREVGHLLRASVDSLVQEFRRAVHDKVIQVGEGLARIFHTRIEQPGGNTVEMPVFIELYAPRHRRPFRDSLSRAAAPL